jgi:mercuric reductase
MLFRRSSGGHDFDLLVLGGGSAAFAAAIRGAELGARVAIAEGGVIGGTCVNRGCFPTKNLLYAAERYHDYRTNGFPGLPRGAEGLSFREVIAQKDELVETMRQHKYWDILAAYPTIRFFERPARLLSAHEAQVGDETVSAARFVIATGASPAPLPVAGMGETPYLTYKEALELATLPRSMVVIGGGPIGLELGQMYARFGTRVTILEALAHIAPLEEPEISAALRSSLEVEGLEVHTGVQVTRVGPGEGVTVVRAQVEGELREFHGEKLLLAAGLRPNTGGLGLEAVGVECDRRGAVVVDGELRTTAKNVWAAGDVVGKLMLVTVAAQQGGLAAENALRGARKRFDDEGVPHAIFTSPQVASVGVKEAEARAQGFRVAVAKIPFDLVPKAGAIRDTRGLLKMVVDEKTYRILGVHLVSAEAADLIHIGVLAVRHKLTVGDLIRATFVYPTLAEAFKIAAISFKKDVTKLSCCAQ